MIVLSTIRGNLLNARLQSRVIKAILYSCVLPLFYSCDHSKEIQAAKEKHIKDSLYAFAPENPEEVRLRDSILTERNKAIGKEQKAQLKAERAESALPVYRVNKPMKLGDFIVTLLKTIEYKNSSDYYQPKQGYRYFAVCVEYENTSTTKILDANLKD
jgi:hypothetical protein